MSKIIAAVMALALIDPAYAQEKKPLQYSNTLRAIIGDAAVFSDSEVIEIGHGAGIYLKFADEGLAYLNDGETRCGPNALRCPRIAKSTLRTARTLTFSNLREFRVFNSALSVKFSTCTTSETGGTKVILKGPQPFIESLEITHKNEGVYIQKTLVILQGVDQPTLEVCTPAGVHVSTPTQDYIVGPGNTATDAAGN